MSKRNLKRLRHQVVPEPEPPKAEAFDFSKRITDHTNHVLACRRYPIAKLRDLIPIRFIEQLEHNQKLSSCCRHPENHDIEAWYSCREEKTPDIYIMYCTCGRQHSRLMVGSDPRPFWDVH